MNLSDYDDMMGLEFGEYEDLGSIFDPEIIKNTLMAGTAGGGAILLTSFGVKKLAEMADLDSRISQPILRSAIKSAVALFAGMAGGRALSEYNPAAGMGVVGGVAGMAMASFLDTVISQLTGNEPIGVSLGEDDSDVFYGDDDGMEALAALETTGVTSAPGAFQGFADPSVTPEALMGLDGTVVQQETLGDYNAYLS